MESDTAAAEEMRRKESEAVERTNMEGLEEEDGWKEGGAAAEEDEEAELAGGVVEGDRYKWEEKAIGREGWRQPVAAGHLAAWRGRGGRGRRGGGRGGFHFHCSWNLQHQTPDIANRPGVYGGAIIICNGLTKRDFFQHKLFALPGYAATFIKKIRAGMLLFLFEFEERKLYGVLEAASDGALNILPDAFDSLWKFRPSQVLFRRVWFCKPLTVAEFSGAVDGDCLKPHMSFFGISYQQVLNLVDLFSSKMIQLQAFQKPKSRVIADYKISLARAGQAFISQTHNNACPSRDPSMFHKNRTSLPHIPFINANVSPLHPCLKPVVFKEPDIKEKLLKPDADFIPLELDDPDDSERDADQSTLVVRLHSTLKGSIKYENPITKRLNRKHDEHDSYHSHLLNRRTVSECETGQKNVIDRIVKESKSSLQNKGCKRKIQVDEYSDVLSPRKVCSAAKKVSFSTGGNEVSITCDGKISSDMLLHLPAFAENRSRVVEERKDEEHFSPQVIHSKERDDSANTGNGKLISFAERLRNQLAQSCSRNGESLEVQAGIKLT